jgi:hypothetical protein
MTRTRTTLTRATSTMARSIARTIRDIVEARPAPPPRGGIRRKRPTEDVRFVYKGRYYRRRCPPRGGGEIHGGGVLPPEPELIPKLPLSGPLLAPRPFVTPPSRDAVAHHGGIAAADAASALASCGGNPSSSGGGGGGGWSADWNWRDWWRLNVPLIIMNFGSLCTLVAFTRSDVLELRCCSVMGSTSFVAYSLLQPPPIRWGPTSWSVLFAAVNSYKILQILDERRGEVDLNPREYDVYLEHFMPHGVTPKQFEKVYRAGTTRTIRKGHVITREGEVIDSVKLIVRGNTRASTLGRHLTAMGSREGNRDAKQGGDSGTIALKRGVWIRV